MPLPRPGQLRRGASQCSAMSGHTKSHRNHRNLTGWYCNTRMHSFRRNCLTTCSNLEQVPEWELSGQVSAQALALSALLSAVGKVESVGLVQSPGSLQSQCMRGTSL